MRKCEQCRTPLTNPRLKKYCSALCKNEAALIDPDSVHHCWCCNEIIPPRFKGVKKRNYRKFINREHYRAFLRHNKDGRKRLLASPTKRITPEIVTYNQRIVIAYLRKFGSLSTNSSVLYHGYKHTLNALEKRNIVYKEFDVWHLTEKGRRVNVKIKNFTLDLLERIRNFPLRKS